MNNAVEKKVRFSLPLLTMFAGVSACFVETMFNKQARKESEAVQVAIEESNVNYQRQVMTYISI